MGFFDRIKNAVYAVASAAKANTQPSSVGPYSEDTLKATATASSTGSQVKSRGIFVDLMAGEELRS